MKGRVAVITGFYGSPHYLITLFSFLDKQTFRLFDVYVYNYSYESITALKGLNVFFPYQILKLPENVGFAGGNNVAIKTAKKHYDYTFYALINDDTKPDRHWLENLVKTAASDKAIGAVTSKMVFYEPFIVLSGKTEGSKIEDSRNLGCDFMPT